VDVPAPEGRLPYREGVTRLREHEQRERHSKQSRLCLRRH
jgi:hypothetical protein